jgi:hypothetical protein
MFKVQANSLDEYFDADRARKADLQAMDALIRKAVPGLERWFYAGAKADGPGMKMILIGYGSFQYEVRSGQRVTWPIVGLALQKNYISLYTSVVKDGAPITERHKGALGELRSGRGNFSFATFAQLNSGAAGRAGRPYSRPGSVRKNDLRLFSPDGWSPPAADPAPRAC